MAVTTGWMNYTKLILFDNSHADAINLLAMDIRVGLMLVAYAPGANVDTYDFWGTSGVSSLEISASSVTNYAANGNGSNLASKAVNRDDANDRAEFDAANLTYSAIGGATNATFDSIQLFRWDSAPGNSPCLGWVDGMSSTTTNGGDITLVWNAEGIMQLT